MTVTKQFGRWLFLCFALALLSVKGHAQDYRRGVLYHLIAVSEGMTVETDNAGKLKLSALDSANPNQHYTLNELSGSWRFINPFNNRAIRTEGDAMEHGENNGSDEAQLWKTEKNGNFVTLVPTNRPDMAAAVSNKQLVLIKKTQAKGNKAAQFEIRQAAHSGFDVALTYRIRSVKNPDLVLGNQDNGANGAGIFGEAVDEMNRGQYWSVKMLDLDRRVVENAFYVQNFDDGGDNASVKQMLQWAPYYGVWRNAQFLFDAVKDQPNVYIIRSANPKKADVMYALQEGKLMKMPYDAANQAAWFTFEQVDKPKIKSPYWEDETKFEENKEIGVATYMPYDSEAAMLADKAYYDTPWTTPHNSRYLSLNGMWKFNLVSEPEQRPLNFFEEGFNTDSWDNIPVPSNWEMQGYDRPIYANVE